MSEANRTVREIYTSSYSGAPPVLVSMPCPPWETPIKKTVRQAAKLLRSAEARDIIAVIHDTPLSVVEITTKLQALGLKASEDSTRKILVRLEAAGKAKRVPVYKGKTTLQIWSLI